jgi:hypothetical protein
MLSTYNRKTFKDRVFNRGRAEIIFLQEFVGSGRLTRSAAVLNTTVLAVAYKVEGRKIARKDAMRTLTHDIREMNLLLGQIEPRIADISGQFAVKMELRGLLEEVKNHIMVSDKARQMIAEAEDSSDEPISKVLYPGGIDPTSVTVWNDYKAWYKEGDRLLSVEALRAPLSRVAWLSDVDIEVCLEGRAVKYIVTPLQPVEENARDDEIRVGDIALLCGQYLILAEPMERGGGENQFLMVNYLRVTSMEEQTTNRRRANRAKPPEAMMLSFFV